LADCRAFVAFARRRGRFGSSGGDAVSCWHNGRPYVLFSADVESSERNKNDAADAEAICEAVRRLTMRFVQIKSPGSIVESSLQYPHFEFV
jgi:hypothetical protein